MIIGNTMRRLIFLCVIILNINNLLSNNFGTTIHSFLKLNPGANINALANSNSITSQNNIFGVYSNPALLNTIKKNQFGLYYSKWYEDVQYGFLGTNIRLNSSTDINLEKMLLVEDYEDMSGTLLMGLEGTWKDASLTDKSNIEFSRIRAEDKYSNVLAIEYKIETDVKGRLGYWLGLEDINVNGYKMIYFQINSKNPDSKIYLGLKDKNDKEKMILLNDYVTFKKSEWTSVAIPLALFNKLDLGCLQNISLSFTENSDSLKVDNIFFIKGAHSFGQLGLFVNYLNSGEMQRIIETNTSPYYQIMDDNFFMSDYLFALTYANELNISNTILPFGVTMKFINENIDNYLIRSILFDIGGIYKYKFSNTDIVLAGSIQNIGIQGINRSTEDKIPININVGANINYKNYALYWDFNIPRDYNMKFRVGLEYNLFDLLFLRAGYSLLDAVYGFGGLNMGFGINLGFLNLDYSFLPSTKFGFAHSIDLVYKYGSESLQNLNTDELDDGLKNNNEHILELSGSQGSKSDINVKVFGGYSYYKLMDNEYFKEKFEENFTAWSYYLSLPKSSIGCGISFELNKFLSDKTGLEIQVKYNVGRTTSKIGYYYHYGYIIRHKLNVLPIIAKFNYDINENLRVGFGAGYYNVDYSEDYEIYDINSPYSNYSMNTNGKNLGYIFGFEYEREINNSLTFFVDFSSRYCHIKLLKGSANMDSIESNYELENFNLNGIDISTGFNIKF